MMVADAPLRRAIRPVVRPGVPEPPKLQCRRTCAALSAVCGAALKRAGVLPRTGPAYGRGCGLRRSGCGVCSAAGPATVQGKGGRQDKRSRHPAA
ncbi:hypothetical protein D9M68_230220 [compost metagenome]